MKPMEPDEMGCTCLQACSDTIALLEERLAKARGVIEDVADGPYTHKEKARFARNALAEIWPTPPKPRVIEVGGVYMPKTGSPQTCVYIRGEFAYMLPLKAGHRPAYAWDIYGKSLNHGSAYDIDWSRS